MIKLIDILKSVLYEIKLPKAIEYIKTLNPKEENPTQIANNFINFQNNLPKRDLFLYKDFNELIRDIEIAKKSKNQKRIKAGKVDAKDLSDPNLIYNEGGIRIYKALTNKDTIKYGCNTRACISSRGTGEEDFFKHNTSLGGVFFFIFNDNIKDTKDPKHINILKIEKFNKTEPYQLWLNTNDMQDPTYSGQYDIVSSVIPQLKNKQSLFDNYIPIIPNEKLLKIKEMHTIIELQNIDKQLEQIFEKYVKYSKLWFRLFGRTIKKINIRDLINNIIENKLDYFIIEINITPSPGNESDVMFRYNKAGFKICVTSPLFFTNSKDKAIDSLNKNINELSPSVEGNKWEIINIQRVPFIEIKPYLLKIYKIIDL
jgi:hypothetical protein